MLILPLLALLMNTASPSYAATESPRRDLEALFRVDLGSSSFYAWAGLRATTEGKPEGISHVDMRFESFQTLFPEGALTVGFKFMEPAFVRNVELSRSSGRISVIGFRGIDGQELTDTAKLFVGGAAEALGLGLIQNQANLFDQIGFSGSMDIRSRPW